MMSRWDDTMKYLQPTRQKLADRFDSIVHHISKQKYLEALSWNGGGGNRHALVPWRPGQVDDPAFDSEEILVLLKSLETSCSKEVLTTLYIFQLQLILVLRNSISCVNA